MLFQDVPADTTGYMILGFSVIFGVLGVYLFSMFSRRRNVEKDVALLEELEEE